LAGLLMWRRQCAPPGGGKPATVNYGHAGGDGVHNLDLDLDLDLVTYCAVNWLTIAQARRQTEMHSGGQRAEV